jgi:hypothetical protein
MGITAAAIVGGAAVLGAGISAGSSMYSADQARKAGASTDKKMIKRADQVANQGLDMQRENTAQLLANLGVANDTYRAKGYEASGNFMNRMSEAIGGAPSFTESQNQITAKSDLLQQQFNERSSTLAQDSGEQTLEFNQAHQQDFIAFADALAAANAAQSRRSAFAINPALEAQARQAAVNNDSFLQGIIPTDVAAQIARSGASTANLSGVGGGSQMGQNIAARDLGLTSLGLMQGASKDVQDWQQTVWNPIQAGTNVNSLDTTKIMGLDTSQVLDTNRQTLTNWATLGDNSLSRQDKAAALVLATRQTANQYDYGQIMNMEGNIYNGSIQTYNNAATLTSNAISAWGNQRLGITSQAWQNQQAQQAASQNNAAALAGSAMSSTATLAGAYMGSRNNALNNTNTAPTAAPAATTANGVNQ